MSDKAIAKKLLIKDGYGILLVNEPKGYRELLGPLSNTLTASIDTEVDFVQIFVTSREDLEEKLSKIRAVLRPKGLLWVTYPKGTSKVKTDLNRDKIREYAKKFGFEAIAMVSIDETWSALRLKAA